MDNISAGKISGLAKRVRNVLQQNYFGFIVHTPSVEFFLSYCIVEYVNCVKCLSSKFEIKA